MPVYAYPTRSDRHIRIFFSGYGGADNLLWLTRERQVVGCTYPSSAFNKKKNREDRVWKREQAEAPQRSVSVYAYPTCSDRHIRTFFSGFSGTDNLLWLTREWQVVGSTYPSSAFNKGKIGASGKGGCAVRKIIRTSIVKPSVWCGYADFLSAMPPVPMTGPYHVRVNHQHGFTCAKKNNKKRKRQDPVKVPLSHSHERVVRLPIV